MGLTVKIFLGLEYECPRGHRFMAGGPDKPMKYSSGGSGGGTNALRGYAAKIINSDMTLYMGCPCR